MLRHFVSTIYPLAILPFAELRVRVAMKQDAEFTEGG